MNFGRYEIIREVGRGAMGVVYQARDPHIDRLVAVKVLRRDRIENETFVRRFMKEAKVIGRLSHPHIVTIYDVGDEQGNIYIAMEFLEGKSLADVMGERRLDAKEVADFGIQIAETLDYAHGKGVIHRDIKPSNIIVLPDGQIKITDFGIARLEDSTATLQTQTGEILGTPAYMSPEQVMGNPVDGRSDIFSLGVILYEMSAGRRPFGGEAKTIATVFTDIIQITPPEPATVMSDIRRDLSGCIMKTLEKDPEKRFQRGSELSAALRASMGEKVEPVAPEPGLPGKKRGPAMAIAVMVVLAAVVGWTLYRSGDREALKPSLRPGAAPAKTMDIPPAPGAATEGIAPSPDAGVTGTGLEKTKQEPAGDVKKQTRLHIQEPPDQKRIVTPPSAKTEPEPKTFSLLINTTPQGASVYIDGKLKGRSPLTVNLPKGGHLVRAARQGYKDLEKEIVLEKTMESPLVLVLKEAAEADDWVIKPLVDRPKQ